MAARAHSDDGFERRLWNIADALRGSMDASEYKNVVLGLIFLKYISDAFEARRAELDAAIQNSGSELYFDDYDRGVAVVLEDRDRYLEAQRLLGPAAGALGGDPVPGQAVRAASRPAMARTSAAGCRRSAVSYSSPSIVKRKLRGS